MKVYIVTSTGQVEGVFKTLTLAEKYIELYNKDSIWDDTCLEDYDLIENEFNTFEIPQGLT